MHIEVQYQEESVRQKASSWAVINSVGVILFLLLLACGGACFPKESISQRVLLVVCAAGGLVAAAACTIGFTSAYIGLKQLAGKLARTADEATKIEKKAILFDVFRPDEEETERVLAIRAHCFNAACEAQADFYKERAHFLGDRAEGNRVLVDGSLVRAEEFLKSTVKKAKVDFWALYDNLCAQGYKMRDGWQHYLTHAGVGPNDPQVVVYGKSIADGVASALKGDGGMIC